VRKRGSTLHGSPQSSGTGPALTKDWGLRGRKASPFRAGMDSPLIFKYAFSKQLSMARRVKAIRATVSMKIAVSEPLLALVITT